VPTLSSLASPPLDRKSNRKLFSIQLALCHPDAPCHASFPTRFAHALRSLTFVLDLMGDGLRFLCLTVRSHSALSAEVLFPRKQLAFYEERERQPRRLTNSARLSLVLWSQLFDWKSALVIVKP